MSMPFLLYGQQFVVSPGAKQK